MAELGGEIALEEPRLLIVEGTHDKAFFQALLRHMGIAGQERVEVLDVGGKTGLSGNLTLVARSPELRDFAEKGTAISLGVVRDADDNAASAFESVNSALRNNGFPVPDEPGAIRKGNLSRSGAPAIPDVAISVFIMPGAGGTGALEELCIDAIHYEPAYACVEAFFECIDREAPLKGPRRVAKAHAHAYLATKADPVTHAGLGAQKGYWPFDSEVFDELKAFLRQVASGA